MKEYSSMFFLEHQIGNYLVTTKQLEDTHYYTGDIIPGYFEVVATLQQGANINV